MILKLGYEDARARVSASVRARVRARVPVAQWPTRAAGTRLARHPMIDGNVTTPPSGRLARGRRLPLTSVKRANQPGQDTLRKDPQQENRLAHTRRYTYVCQL
jgi:hypothetical protein